VSDSEIFDRAARRLRRDRAAGAWSAHAFLRDIMLDGIAERLAAVKRRFADVLDLGCADAAFTLPGARLTRVDAGAIFAARAGGIQADEDRTELPAESFDLIVSAGTLDTVNDVPGALTLARRALRPDGLFLAAFVGGGSLPTLRAALREVDPGTARMHPQIDVRSAGDLLVRAGFALPVADIESVPVRYGNLFSLVADLRGMAASNMLRDRHPLHRSTLAELAAAYAARADADGRIPERFEVIYLTGWAPSPDQPKPARRGSATARLADALQQGVE